MLRFILASLVLAVSAEAIAQSDRFILDGLFDEWTEEHLLYDATGSGTWPIDLGRFWAHAQEDYLFLSFETGGEINLQRFNDLTLYIDTDRDPTTGVEVNGIGADVVWRFGHLNGTYHGGGAPIIFGHHSLGIISAPTHSWTRFEIALRLDAEVEGNALFPHDSVYIILRDNADGDGIPATGGLLVSLTPSEAPPFEIELERHDPDHLRLVSYNVWGSGIFDPQRIPIYQRILQALDPDVIAWQEIYNATPEAVGYQMEVLLPSGPDEQWYVEGAGDGDIYLASRFPIDYSEALCRLPDSPNTCNGAFRLDLSTTYARNLYILNAHPPCCNSDVTRQVEIDQMMAHIRDARTDDRLPEGTPFVITGDLNLVGFYQQLHTLLTGDIVNTHIFGAPFQPDWDGSDLVDARPLTTAMPAAFTWYNPNSTFHPGRLDFVIYSGSVLEVANRFNLFTPSMPVDVLSAYGLFAGDSPTASDHLPVVADLVLPLLETGTESGGAPADDLVGAVYPNPAAGVAQLPLVLRDDATVEVELVDLLGRRVWLQRRAMGAGEQKMLLDLAGLPSGIYIVRASTERTWTSQRIVIVR